MRTRSKKFVAEELLLARLMGQYCFVRWCLSSSVVCNAIGGRVCGPCAWAVGGLTLHGGPVRLRSVRATSCVRVHLLTDQQIDRVANKTIMNIFIHQEISGSNKMKNEKKATNEIK